MGLAVSLLTVALLVAILILAVMTLSKVNKLQMSNCAGVPDFVPNSVYTKSISTYSGTATFAPDGTFTAVFSDGTTPKTYSNNTWVYDKANCQLVVTWDPAIAADIAPTTVGSEVKLNSAGQLVLTVNVFGVLGMEVALDRQQ